MRAADHDLARFARRLYPAGVVEDQHLGTVQRGTARAGLEQVDVGFGDGHSLALGDAEHGVHGRVRERPAQRGDQRTGQGRPGVGEHAHRWRRPGVPGGQAYQHVAERRHDRYHRHAVPVHGADQPDVRAGIGEHQLGAGEDGQEHLVQAVVEGQRDGDQHHVVVAVPQPGGDRLRGEQDGPVRTHDGLRYRCAAGRVDEQRQVVRVDAGAPVPGVAGRVHELGQQRGRPHRQRRDVGDGRRVVGDHHPRLRVVDDVSQVVRLHLAVQRDERGAQPQRAEHQGEELAAVAQPGHHPVAGADALAGQPLRARVGGTVQLGVRPAAVHVPHGVRLGARRERGVQHARDGVDPGLDRGRHVHSGRSRISRTAAEQVYPAPPPNSSTRSPGSTDRVVTRCSRPSRCVPKAE